MIKIDDISLLKLLPNFLQEDTEIKFLIQVIQEELELINTKEKNLFLYGNFKSLGENILDELAYQWRVEGYEQTLSKDTKSSLVETAYIVRKTKGTRYAVEKTVKDIHGEFKLQEWFEYNGEPYHFKIIGTTTPSPEKLEKIYNVISKTKNERSYLDEILISKTWSKNEYHGITLNQNIIETLEFSQKSRIKVEDDIRWNNDGWESNLFSGVLIHQNTIETIIFSQESKDEVEEYIAGGN